MSGWPPRFRLPLSISIIVTTASPSTMKLNGRGARIMSDGINLMWSCSHIFSCWARIFVLCKWGKFPPRKRRKINNFFVWIIKKATTKRVRNGRSLKNTIVDKNKKNKLKDLSTRIFQVIKVDKKDVKIEKSEEKVQGVKMIDIKNSSTDYLQRTSGTFNNISMLFAGNFLCNSGFFK